MALDTAKTTAILRDITVHFDRQVKSAKPFYPRVSTIAPSKGADEKYSLLGNMPGMREWLGERKFEELRAATFTIANRDWESSIDVEKNDIEDDRIGMYPNMARALAQEAVFHPDELLFDEMIANAETKAGFDGQFFYYTDHSWGDSGSQSNDLAASAVDTANITAAEFKTSFHAALEAMTKFKNDRGKFLMRPVVTDFKKLLVVVPPEMRVAATEALKSQLLGGGDTNIVLDNPTIVSTPHLTSSVKWHLFNTGGIIKPFIFQARRPLRRGHKGMNDQETKIVKFMTDARYNMGYGAWWDAILTTFA